MRINHYTDQAMDAGQAQLVIDDLATKGVVHMMIGTTPCTIAMDDAGLIFVGSQRAGVYLTPDTPFNKFELVRGGFRLDIADRLLVVFNLLRTEAGRVEGAPVIPQISHHKGD